MKPAVFFTAVSLIALSVVGLGRLNAANEASEASTAAPSEIRATVSDEATVAQDANMSEHGLAAISSIHLARVAINDGYVERAQNLLHEAHTLLGRVMNEDMPITVTTEVKVGGKTTEKETMTAKPDLIPILSQLQVVEGFSAQPDEDAATPQSAQPTADQAAAPSAGKHSANNDAEPADNADRPANEDKMAAVGQAREQLSKGDRQGAIETLRLVDLALVTRTLSMPLAETNAHVDKAMSLLDAGKLHEANLELKQVRDGLVSDTVVMIEPAVVATPDQVVDARKAQPETQASAASDNSTKHGIAHAN